MSRLSFQDFLKMRPWLLADGATGTNLFEMGLMSGDPPELWNLDFPQRIADLHRGFIDAGSDLILTNSFGGNAYRLRLHGAENQVFELNQRAAALAREQADAAHRPVLVAGSMGPTGEIFEPVGTLSHQEGVRVFKEQAHALAAGGADVLWIETLSAQEEFLAAVEGAFSVGLPVVVTLSFDTNGCTMMGLSPDDFSEMAQFHHPQLAAFGANCGTGASDLVLSILAMSQGFPSAPLVAKGNCGIPQYRDGHIHYSGTPDLMAEYAILALEAGASIIGGCCGTGFEHVRAMRSSLEAYQKKGQRPTLEEIVDRLGPLSQPLKSLEERACAHQSRPRRRGRGGA